MVKSRNWIYLYVKVNAFFNMLSTQDVTTPKKGKQCESLQTQPKINTILWVVLLYICSGNTILFPGYVFKNQRITGCPKKVLLAYLDIVQSIMATMLNQHDKQINAYLESSLSRLLILIFCFYFYSTPFQSLAIIQEKHNPCPYWQ